MGIDWCKKLRNDETYKIFFQSFLEFCEKIKKEKIKINDKINSIFEKILIHIFGTIPEVDDKRASIFIETLNKILALNIQLKNFSNEFIDFTTGLGKFGQHVIKRKYCVYLSINILRLNNNYNEDIYKRIILLCEDCERMVKYECAFQLRYLYESINQFYYDKNSKYEKLKNINDIYKNYLDDMEISLRSIVIESILYSIKDDIIQNSELIEIMNKHIKNIFNQDDNFLLDEDYQYLILIFTSLTNYLNDYGIEVLNNNLFESYKIFLNNFIFFKRKKAFDYSFLFEIFDKVVIVIKKYKDNDLLNKLFNHIYSQSLFPPEMDDTLNLTNNSFYNSQSDFSENNKFRKTFIILKNVYKKLFYDNLSIILKELNNDFLPKLILENIFPFISNCKDENINKKKNNSNKKQNERTFVKEYSIKNEMKEVIYKIDEIFNVLKKINCVNFFYNFYINFDCFTKVLKNFIEDKTNKHYNLIIKILKTLGDSIEFLYNKFYNTKYEQYEIFISYIYNFGKQYLLPKISSFEINIQVVKLFIKIMKFWIKREEIINLFNKDYSQNTSFYYRRIYLIFAENCFEYFSIEFIKKYKIYDNLLDLKDFDQVDIIKNQIEILLKKPILNNTEKQLSEKEIYDKESKILEERRKDENLFKLFGKNKKYKNKKVINNNLLTVPNSEKRKKHYIDKKVSIKQKRRESANDPFEILTIERQNSLGNK